MLLLGIVMTCDVPDFCRDNVGTTDMQAAGKLLNHIAGTVANTAAAAADIPLNQLQYNLGDGTKVTLFGDALSDPGAIAEKFGVFSCPSTSKQKFMI